MKWKTIRKIINCEENKLDYIEKLNYIEQKINKSKVEEEIYKKRLKELKPDKERLEKESVENFNVEIDELTDYSLKLQSQLQKETDKLYELLSEIEKDN